MSHTKDLTVEESQMLARAAEAGGSLSVRGGSDAEMAHTAYVATRLHRLGLVDEPTVHKSRRKGADIIDVITVSLTEVGRRCFAES